MFKKIFLSLILLCCIYNLFATTDLGTTETLIVRGARTSEGAVNSSAVVFTVDSKKIETAHYESLSDAVTSVAEATINSTGTLGAMQNANVNGMGAGRTKVYVDGTLVSTSYDNCFDLNAIPISAVEKIEIITSGTGKNGQKIAAGGVINIITKKSDGKPSLNLSFENGSFLPSEKGMAALIDSQDFHAVYTDTVKGQNILISIGGMRAGNNYSYKAENYGIQNWTLMKNNDTWAADLMANINGTADSYEYASNNLIRYQHLGVPGSCSYATPEDFQNNLFLNSANSLNLNGIKYSLNYTYNPVLVYHTQTGNDSHFKHNLSFKAETEYEISQNISVSPYAETVLETAKSTSLKKVKLRFYPRIGFSSAIAFSNLTFYPSADIGFTTDMKKWFANASLGSEYSLTGTLTATGNFSFAHRLPTFSDLYWPFTDYGWGFTYRGNPHLKPEKALSADLGLNFSKGIFNSGLAFFTRWINDQILTSNDYSTMENIDDALYIGFNFNNEIRLKNLTASIGWMFNKSYNLTGTYSVNDNVAVSGVRLNTLTFNLSWQKGNFTLSSDGKYMGKYFNSAGKEFDGAFIWNVGADYRLNEKLKLFVKLDNILNSQYQLSDGYPMPGLKARIGGTWTII